MNDELRVKNNELGGKMKYRYRTDEEMKDSGVEWIGKIPKGWSVNRLKNITNIFGRIGFRGYTVEDLVNEGEGAITLSPSNIENQSLVLDKKTYISWSKYEESPEIKIYNGDIVFVKTASVGKAALIEGLNEKATINPQFVVFKNIGCNKKYLYYNTISNVIQQQVNRAVNGGVVGTLTQQDINNYSLPYPTIVEQEKIAKFLDEKTAQFDSIISKKEALIEKLEEAKKSLISEVVTGKVKVVKTDDGYKLVERKKEEMKDSGVEWLGLVPTEWKIYRSKYLWKKEKREVKEEYGVVTAFRDGEVTLRENRRTEGFTFAIKEIGYQGVLKGDLVISAMDAFAGAMGISDSEGKCSPVYSVCSPVKELEPQYYNYLLKEMSQKGYILSLAKGIRERSTDFRYSEFANTFLLYPNIEEQKIIANYLFEKVIFINNFIITINNQIEKLKEAKQSLISEAVTGKIEILD